MTDECWRWVGNISQGTNAQTRRMSIKGWGTSPAPADGGLEPVLVSPSLCLAYLPAEAFGRVWLYTAVHSSFLPAQTESRVSGEKYQRSSPFRKMLRGAQKCYNLYLNELSICSDRTPTNAV